MTTNPRGHRAAPLLLVVLALVASACGGSSSTSSDAPTEASTAGASGEQSGPGTDQVVVSDDPRGVEVAGEVDSKPEITLPGGDAPTELVVVDIEEGDGEVVPADATVTTHYVGVSWTNDGAEFDSSWDRGEPISFPLGNVISGWTQGIPGMRVGGRRLLIIPPDLAYGASPPSGADIAADDTLVFVIDMVDFQGPPEPVTPTTDAMGVEVEGEAGSKPSVTLPGGEPPTELVVVDLIEGEGEVVPVGSTVTTDYVGVSWTNEGAEFDSSWDRGEPATFPLGNVIPGWTQGIPGMRVGGRRLLIIPPDLAYADAPPTPAIAPGDTLVFVIDMVGVQ